MKILKGLVFTSIVLVALFAIGRLFLAQLGTEYTAAGPPGVILAAPPGMQIEDLGEVTRTEAVLRLSDLLGPSGNETDAGVHFSSADGREIYWYAERDDTGEPILVERRSGPGKAGFTTRTRLPCRS